MQADAYALRVVHESSPRTKREAGPDTRPADLVPVPLSAEVWSSAIFHRQDRARRSRGRHRRGSCRRAAVSRADRAGRRDARVSFAEHPALLTRIYEHSAPIFAAFSDGLHIFTATACFAPGGDEAAAVVGKRAARKTTRPDRFVVQLFPELNDGRLAYLYDNAVSQLDPALPGVYARPVDAGRRRSPRAIQGADARVRHYSRMAHQVRSRLAGSLHRSCADPPARAGGSRAVNRVSLRRARCGSTCSPAARRSNRAPQPIDDRRCPLRSTPRG